MKRMRGIQKGICLSLTVLIILTFVVTGALSKSSKKDYKHGDIEIFLTLENSQAEFNVNLWTDRDDATYRIGERVTFFFKTDKDCRVTLLNVGTDGKVQILFPNDYHRDNRVKAGTTYIIPPREAQFDISAMPPAGVDVVKAIATLDKVALIKDDDIITVNGLIKGFKGVNKNARTLTIELKKSLKPINPKTWAEAQKIVKIIPAMKE